MRSAAKPAPIPDFLVGVLTETKIRLTVSFFSTHAAKLTHSASAMALSTSVLKKRFFPLAPLTTSSSPGS